MCLASKNYNYKSHVCFKCLSAIGTKNNNKITKRKFLKENCQFHLSHHVENYNKSSSK